MTDKKKITAYPDLVNGYKKFLGKKAFSWFQPPKNFWQHGGLAVSVNPELGLELNDQRHVVKLYFKVEKLAKIKMDIVTHMMTQELIVPGPKPVGFGTRYSECQADPGQQHRSRVDGLVARRSNFIRPNLHELIGRPAQGHRLRE